MHDPIRRRGVRPLGTKNDERNPAIDQVIRDALQAIFADLLTDKGLYQNLRLDLSILSQYVDDKTGMDDYVAEFITRPVIARSRGEGDDELLALRSSRDGYYDTHNIGDLHELSPISFVLPNISSDCPECRKLTPYLSRSDSATSYYGRYVPPRIKRGDPLHQHFGLFYTCSDCSKHVLAFQVIRDGLRYQLTGRSLPFRPKLDGHWPKVIKPIVQDALVAMAENDLPAAYYHLRTALEHYMKGQLQIDFSERMEGTNLCDLYNARIDTRLKSGFPSVATIYSGLSVGLHTRVVSVTEFNSLIEQLLDHLKGKLLFDKYAS